jgi:uncharacterized protein (TIGR00369 family)
MQLAESMTQTEPARTRTYSWTDPGEVLSAASGRSGLELLTLMAQGRVPSPPIAATTDFVSFEVADGLVAVTLQPQEFHYNPIGTVHGGVIATLLDTVAGCAVHSTLPAGAGYTSLDLLTKFLRPVTMETGVVRAEGRVIHRGSRLAQAEATLTDQRGRLLASATSSCLILGP